jgi:hypothetical protein
MVKSKTEIIEKLTKLTGAENDEWKNWPVHKLLVELDKYKDAADVDEEDKGFRSRLYGSFRAE